MAHWVACRGMVRSSVSLTFRREQAPREALPGPASQREAKMMSQAFQPRRSAREWAGNRRIKTLREDPLTAIGHEATGPPRQNPDPDRFPL
jgi:hypothetical protein